MLTTLLIVLAIIVVSLVYGDRYIPRAMRSKALSIDTFKGETTYYAVKTCKGHFDTSYGKENTYGLIVCFAKTTVLFTYIPYASEFRYAVDSYRSGIDAIWWDFKWTFLEDKYSLADDTHCKHGNYVGDWAGPDYMCGICEMAGDKSDFMLFSNIKTWRTLKYVPRDIKNLLHIIYS